MPAPSVPSLRADEVCAQLTLKHRQCDVDNRAVDEGDARPQDGRRQHPRRGSFGARDICPPGPHYCFIARRFNDGRQLDWDLAT